MQTIFNNFPTASGLQLEYDGFAIKSKEGLHKSNLQTADSYGYGKKMNAVTIVQPGVGTMWTITSQPRISSDSYNRVNRIDNSQEFTGMSTTAGFYHTFLGDMNTMGLKPKEANGKVQGFCQDNHLYTISRDNRYNYLYAYDVTNNRPERVLKGEETTWFSQDKFGFIYKPSEDRFYIMMKDGIYKFTTPTRIDRIKEINLDPFIYSGTWIDDTIYGFRASGTNSSFVELTYSTGSVAQKNTYGGDRYFMEYYLFKDNKVGMYRNEMAQSGSSNFNLTTITYDITKKSFSSKTESIPRYSGYYNMEETWVYTRCRPKVLGYGGTIAVFSMYRYGGLSGNPSLNYYNPTLFLKEIDTTSNVMNITGTGEVKYQFSDETQATKVTLPATIKNPTLSSALKIKGIKGKNVAFTKL